MQFSATSHVGRVRPDNEDAWCIEELDPDGATALLVVADGMGGAAAGEVASTLAVRTVREAVRLGLAGWTDAAACRSGLEAAVTAAHTALCSAQDERPDLKGMGTTLTLALICSDTLHLAHVGDSRAYLVQGGEIRQLTDDHSVVGELVRGGSLSEAEAMHHPQRHLLTHALGTKSPLKIDLVDAVWEPGAVLLLCTDGLTNLVPATELLALVEPASAFESLAQRLAGLANERGGHDNITVVAARYGGDAGPARGR